MKRANKTMVLSALVPFCALLMGVIVTSFFIALTGVSPFSAFRVLLSGAFGTSGRVWPLLITLGQATPLILTGLAAMYSFRVGIFCIAQEGQYVFGAIVAAWLGVALSLPPLLHIIVVLAASMLVGVSMALFLLF